MTGSRIEMKAVYLYAFSGKFPPFVCQESRNPKKLLQSTSLQFYMNEVTIKQPVLFYEKLKKIG
jgi:hypothetical protein